MLSGFFGMSGLPKRSVEYSFQTPNYPAPYPLNIECIKVIAAPTDQHRILLHFRGTFELEPESHCTTDFLEIRDGAFGFTTLLEDFVQNSDSTIAHRGFQAVYRFLQAGSRKSTDSVSHIQFQVNLQPGQTWKLDQHYLLTRIRKLSSEIQHLPLEAALDIRSTNGTFIMLHIDHIQVPPPAAWSCQPETVYTKMTRIKCLTGEPIVFGPEKKKDVSDGTDSGLDKLSLQDPASVVDGQHTFFEIYPGKTISQFVPPCPKITRFCDKTVGILKLTSNHGSSRDFFIRHPRLIIRMVIASPLMKPELLAAVKSRREVINSPGNSSSKLLKTVNTRTRRQTSISDSNMDGSSSSKDIDKISEYMPKFDFILTSLKQKSNAGEPCDKDWEACDSEVCIPKSSWCDKIINCPQWQDEGGHCISENLDPDALGPDGRPLRDAGKSSFELRKEQEHLEAEAERLAAQKLHLSILASLGLLLLIVTSTCIIMTMRRRGRERGRHITKPNEEVTQSSKSNHRRVQRLNHVMSTGALLKTDHSKTEMNSNNTKMKPIFSLSSSSLTKDEQYPTGSRIHELKTIKSSSSRNTTVWNSTDSIDAPLLWQRKVDDMKSPCRTNQKNTHKSPLLQNRFSKTTPDNLYREMNDNVVQKKPLNDILLVDYRNVNKKLQNKVKTIPSSMEQEIFECVQFQGVSSNVNTTGNSCTSGIVINDGTNPLITNSPIRTMNTPRCRPIHSTSITHSYAPQQILPCEQTGVQKRTSEQQTKWIGTKIGSQSVMSSPQNHGNWVATNPLNQFNRGSTTPTPMSKKTHEDYDTEHRLSNNTPSPVIKIHNCMINRTQSWGAGLRYDHNVHPCCEEDQSPPPSIQQNLSTSSAKGHRNFHNNKPFILSSIPRCHLYSVSNSQEHLCRIKRSDTYVSMPDVNGHQQFSTHKHANCCHITDNNASGNIVHTTAGVRSDAGMHGFIGIAARPTPCISQPMTSTKECKPPQAKRPRIVSSLTPTNRQVTPVHNGKNQREMTSHITASTTNNTNNKNNNSSSDSSTEHSQIFLNPSYHHLHRHHLHNHHHMLYPSAGFQNILMRIKNANNLLLYVYRCHKDSNTNSDNNADEVEDDEGDDAEDIQTEDEMEVMRRIRSRNSLLCDEEEEANDEEEADEDEEEMLSNTGNSDLMKAEYESDLENSERFTAENSPVNSTSLSETEIAQKHFSRSSSVLRDESIRITVYPSEPHGIRLSSQTSQRQQQQSCSPKSSSHHHQHRHHQKHFIPKRSNHLQIRSDEQNISETSTDLVYEYEA
ncbi:unnamed protein product [Heterobilharzia americana]|nr:unnamed protein product [Heterobilharzia americana]